MQNDARPSGRLRSGVMGLKAVVAEAQWKQICRAAEGGVRAASVGGGGEYAAFGRSVLQNFFELPCLKQRNVCRDYQRARGASLDRDAGGHLDGSGFSRIVRVGDDFELIVRGQSYR